MKPVLSRQRIIDYIGRNPGARPKDLLDDPVINSINRGTLGCILQEMRKKGDLQIKGDYPNYTYYLPEEPADPIESIHQSVKHVGEYEITHDTTICSVWSYAETFATKVVEV